MLTLFSWGYWGWGNATPEFIRAADATERGRGFKPPIFFDIRSNRKVRAKGFADDAFERLLPRARYRWLPRLGNERIGTGESGIKIADPFAAKILLEEAMQCARDKRRIIFFCACEYPCSCHRRVVARLVLKEARRIGRAVQIVEWPGRSISQLGAKVTPESIFRRVVAGTLKNLPPEDRKLPFGNKFLPWGAILDLESNGRTVSVLSGPARFHAGWKLPIFDRLDHSDSYLRNRKSNWKALRASAETFCRRLGLDPLENLASGTPEREGLRALSIRQPWAHAIIHLGKDVENRTWRSYYTGPVLIHAASHYPKDPRGELAECMSKPPSASTLDPLPRSAIIGVADLYDYVEDSESKWAWPGEWHWLLRNARAINPIPCNGKLGLWKPSASVLKRLPAWAKG